jgi:predicted O-methyltransferase YrrM
VGSGFSAVDAWDSRPSNETRCALVNHHPLQRPSTDPTPIFEHFRGSYATELLTAAVAHFQVFERIASGCNTAGRLRDELQLEQRPFIVLLCALQAMGLVQQRGESLTLSALADEHLLTGRAGDVSDYIGLAARSPGVLEMVERLRTNRPANADAEDGGAAFIFRDGIESAMEQEATARHFTLALAGRAKNVAPALAEAMPLPAAKRVLDVAGGTGIYSIALLQKNPHLTAVVLDRPEVLKITREFAEQYGVADRLECHAGDMFADPLPGGCDVVLLSNVLHDWDVPQCRDLVARCAAAQPAGGKLWIHDVFLNDGLDGPLPIALYSAALFTLTEGRAYSAGEYRSWLEEAGLSVGSVTATLVHCGVLEATKA